MFVAWGFIIVYVFHLLIRDFGAFQCLRHQRAERRDLSWNTINESDSLFVPHVTRPG